MDRTLQPSTDRHMIGAALNRCIAFLFGIVWRSFDSAAERPNQCLRCIYQYAPSPMSFFLSLFRMRTQEAVPMWVYGCVRGVMGAAPVLQASPSSLNRRHRPGYVNTYRQVQTTTPVLPCPGPHPDIWHRHSRLYGYTTTSIALVW